MPGIGPAPKDDSARRRRADPVHGWQYAQGVGWRHGDAPQPPPKLTKTARDAWLTWFGSWFAWFWGPEDLPGLRQVVRLYDRVERGEFQRAGEMRLQMDAYGITPKGQRDRRWRPPEDNPAHREESAKRREAPPTRRRLKVVDPA